MHPQDRRAWLTALAALTFGVAPDGLGAVRDARDHGLTRPAAETSTCEAARVGMPAYFEPNTGQAASESRFVGRAGGRAIHIGDDCAWAQVAPPSNPEPGRIETLPPEAVERGRIGFHFLGATPGSTVTVDPLTSRSNHFLGTDPAGWRTRLPNFRRLLRRGLYPGIDLEWIAREGAFEYRLTVAPGADPSRIRMEWPRGARVAIAADGSLCADSPGGKMTHSRPVAFQREHRRERRVPIEFTLAANGQVEFRVGDYDRARPLVIDPWIEYSTYFGSSTQDQTQNRVAVDSSGSMYLFGQTTGNGSIDVQNPVQQAPAGGVDLYVTKFAPDGATLVYSTYLGSNDQELAHSIAVDANGSAWVTGVSVGSNYPLVSPLYSASSNTCVITKLAPTGDSLEFSTRFVGASGAKDIAVDGAGDVAVCFTSAGSSFPLVNPIRATAVSGDGGLAKIAGDGSAIVYSTYIGGGSGFETLEAVTFDSQGAVYLAGLTQSTDLPLKNAAQGTLAGLADVFVTKVNAAGDDFDYVTYLGGSALEVVYDIAVGTAGDVVVVGSTRSTDFPLASAIQSSNAGGFTDAFVSRIASTGSTLVYSTYLGTSGDDIAWAVVRTPDGSAWVGGSTSSSAFPMVKPLQGTFGGGTHDGFLTRISPAGDSLAFSTYFGGSGTESVYGLATVGSAILASGDSTSSNFPTVNPYHASNTAGSSSAFAVRVVASPLPPTVLLARLTDLTVAAIDWVDQSDEETGFELERSDDGGAFVLLAELPADTVSYEDTDLVRGHTYDYRVRALNDDGLSEYSNSDGVLSPPIPVLPPAAPSALVVTAQSDGSVALSWQDNSLDEERFEVNRSVAGGTFSIRASLISGTTAFLDTTALPDRSHTYGVRAVNSIGVSPFTTAVTATTPQSLDLVLTKGLISDSTRFGRDRIVVKATVAVNEVSPDGAWDPVADGIRLRLGNEAQVPLFNLGPADEGWIARRNGKMFWKSPRESLSKAKILYDPATGALSITLSKLTFVTPPANPILLWLGGANDAGHFEGDWFLRRVGLLKYPVPVPK